MRRSLQAPVMRVCGYYAIVFNLPFDHKRICQSFQRK